MLSGLRELEEYLEKQVAAFRKFRGSSPYQDGLHDGFERALVMTQAILASEETIEQRVEAGAGLG